MSDIPKEVQRERGQRARISADALKYRVPQEELYESVTFPAEHVVGSERAIPLFKNELILSPGHLDSLYQLGVVDKDELYKVTQTNLREGIQRPGQYRVRFKESLQKIFKASPDTFEIRKEGDLVFGKLNLGTVLRKEALDHPDVQTIFLQMIEQQSGSLSLRFEVEVARKQFQKLSTLANPDNELTVLKAETEIKCRRIIMQELALTKFLQDLKQQRPEMAEVYKLDGQRLFIDQIDGFIAKDLGTNRDHLDAEVLTQRVMKAIFSS